MTTAQHAQDEAGPGGLGPLRWLPTVLVLGAVALVVRSAAAPLADPDAWWHLRLGDDLWAQRSLAAPTDWSPRATVPWVPSEPLPEVLAGWVHAWWGLPGLAWLYGAATTVVVLALYGVCRRLAAPLPAAVVTAFGVLAMWGSLTPRPQLVSFVLLLAVPIVWDQAPRRPGAPWLLVPLTWVWSMCHGFWVLGVGLSGLCWLGLVLDRRLTGRAAMKLGGVPVVSAAAVALNPAGWEVLLAPLAVNDTAQYIAEWQRTAYKDASGVVCAVLIAAVVVALVTRRLPADWSTVLLTAAAAFFWWYSLRTVAVAALLIAPLLAKVLDRLVAERRSSPRAEVALLGCGTALALGLLAAAVPHTSGTAGGVPVALSDELDALPAGASVLNAYGWGGWLAWRHPELDRAVDGLVVPYDPAYVERLYRVERAEEGWESLVPGLDVEYALLPADDEVARGLEAQGWRRLALDDGAVILAAP